MAEAAIALLKGEPLEEESRATEHPAQIDGDSSRVVGRFHTSLHINQLLTMSQR